MKPGAGRSAFTLLELLVVIAIIAVLAALLLPALAKGKAAARRTECLTRMKQWSIAFLAYTDDNDGWIPREGYHSDGKVFLNNWAQVKSSKSVDVWYNALADYVGARPASSYQNPVDRPSFYERNSFFHCPSAPLPPQTKSPVYQVAIFSIGMNSQLIEPPEVSTILFDRIARTSQTPLFLENLLDEEEPVVDAQAQNELGQPAAQPNRFAGRRHGQSGNIAFADAHAESVLGIKVVETQGPNRGWGIQPPVDIFWEPDTP
jgi:prepilin-type N-terminal cleavage/methylation domain-containing protein/prepilin-type processing-associated H-X9-DG protein